MGPETLASFNNESFHTTVQKLWKIGKLCRAEPWNFIGLA